MLLDKLFFATIISLLKVTSIDWNILEFFILFYVCLLVADVAVSSSYERKPSMSCILYPMMNFSPQHWQTVYIFKTKFVVDLVYLYRTNFQNVDTVAVSNNTNDTCSAPPPILPPRGLIHHCDSHFDLQLLVSILQYRGLSPDVTTRRAVLILNEWVL